MKLLLPLTAAWFLTLAAAPADFVIVQRVDGTGQQEGNITVKIHEDKSRLDLAPQISQLLDARTGETITLMHAQKTYLKVPAEKTKALLEQMQKVQAASPPPANAAPPKLVATGRKEKVESWDTEIFTWASGPLVARYWVARSFPNFAAIQAGMERASGGSLGAMTKGLTPKHTEFPGMVVKTEMKIMGKTVVSTILSAEEKPVDPRELELPADYKELATPDFKFPTPAPASP